MMNTQQYLKMREQAFANDEITEYPSQAYDINGTWDKNRYTDWQEKLFGSTATNSSIQLSLKGGNKNSSFIVSGRHNEQTTVFSDEFLYKTNKISGKINYRSDDNKFNLTASGIFSDQSSNLIQLSIIGDALLLSPNAPALYNEDASLNWEDNTFVNPIAAYEQTYSYKNKTFISNLNLSYELLPRLNVKLNGGINHQTFNDALLYPHTIYNPAFGMTPASSTAYKSWNQRFSFLLEPQINYKYKIKKHEFDVLVGGTYQQLKNLSISILGFGFESNALINNLVAASSVSATSDRDIYYKYA